jgi:ABC-2 type transport system permease protein
MKGVFPLIKLILRRDRVKLSIWILVIVLMAVSMPAAMHATAGTPQELATLQQQLTSGSAVMNLITGPFQMIGGHIGLGGLTLVKAELFVAVLMAFFATLLIVRHTRANEEIGAAEMLESTQISRNSLLIAAIIVAVGSIVLMTVLMAIGIGASVAGIAGGWGAGAPEVWTGAWLFSLEMGAVGLAFVGIAAVVAQLTETSSSANGILGGIIGVAYLLRGIGDVVATSAATGEPNTNFWTWISPFGWGQATHSLTFANWWPLAVFAIFFVFATVLAFVLLHARDLGSGILPARKGRARAGFFAKNSFTLSLKLHKNIFIGWLLGNLVLVGVIGGASNEINKVYSSSAQMKQYIMSLGGNANQLLVRTMLIGMLTYTAVMVVAFVIQALGKLRAEEASGHLENLLATRVSRIGWISRHALITLLLAVVMITLSGAVAALSANASGVSPLLNVGDFAFGLLAYLPVVIAVIGIYVFLFGVAPRLAGALTWALFTIMLVAQMFLALFVALLNLPKDFANYLPLAPFTHIASSFGGAAASGSDWAIFVGTIVVSALLFAVGLMAWRKRNLASDN